MTASYKDFYQRLYQQFQYLSHGGTNYRKTTAELSLVVAREFKDLTPFLNHRNIKYVVKNHFPNANEERINDVAKMLYVNAKAVVINSQHSDAAKTYVAQKMKDRKLLNLTKVGQ
jgi:predicted DNA-binding helix-hairpin-helix protein